MSGNYWGVTGSNYIKDAKFVNCRLNRIDAHAGAYNLTISNSTIGNRGLTLIGGGKLTIANTTVSGNPNFITLRHDYGSVWDGLVTITNSTFIPPNANDTSLIDFKIEFDGNKIHNFGYDLVLPNVNVNGLKIKKKVKNFSIFDNTKTGKLNGNLLNVNNYTNGEFKYRIPNDIRYSNITSTASKINISKYKKIF
jgi:hypothetical protein